MSCCYIIAWYLFNYLFLTDFNESIFCWESSYNFIKICCWQNILYLVSSLHVFSKFIVRHNCMCTYNTYNWDTWYNNTIIQHIHTSISSPRDKIKVCGFTFTHSHVHTYYVRLFSSKTTLVCICCIIALYYTMHVYCMCLACTCVYVCTHTGKAFLHKYTIRIHMLDT